MASVGQEIAVFVAPSESRFFMAVLGFHLIIALSSVSTGVVAMFSKKRPAVIQNSAPYIPGAFSEFSSQRPFSRPCAGRETATFSYSG